MNNDNKVTLIGKFIDEPVIEKNVRGQEFYRGVIGIARLSGKIDKIPVVIHLDLYKGRLANKCVQVTGEFYSRNFWDGDKRRLELYVYARKIVETEDEGYENTITLNGFICKKPVLRETPGGRKVADLLLAVNRDNGRSDYVPCICWEKYSKKVANLNVGDEIRIAGRIQSRDYFKKSADGSIDNRTAYEISVLELNTKE